MANVAPAAGVPPISTKHHDLAHGGASAQRLVKLKEIIRNMTSFMPEIEVKAIVSPCNGIFGGMIPQTWGLNIYTNGKPELLPDDITYGQYVDLCETVYHECRHLEQTYRVAQLMAHWGRSPASIKPDPVAPGGKVDVKARVKVIKDTEWGDFLHNIERSVTRSLGVPDHVAAHAVSDRNGWIAFTSLPHPSWWVPPVNGEAKVEEWKKEMTIGSGGRNVRTDWLESLATAPTTHAMYKGLSIEADAHGIQQFIAEGTKQVIARHNPKVVDFQQYKDRSRIGKGLFGD